eukprot:CAMPEP_0182480866 /NCGR_PEP_ID=MMETSP1319-20130603/36439_1 /TAXON_ID=172717 /ORGANISM="Bolidomonas pacifica, Strain RCC208" /LENGTH=85 /DNA_ID=CAMNT_0024682417 /DNA_START=307 /DNA_END=564 /DNA_ORIENTATION=-
MRVKPGTVRWADPEDLRRHREGRTGGCTRRARYARRPREGGGGGVHAREVPEGELGERPDAVEGHEECSAKTRVLLVRHVHDALI